MFVSTGIVNYYIGIFKMSFWYQNRCLFITSFLFISVILLNKSGTKTIYDVLLTDLYFSYSSKFPYVWWSIIVLFFFLFPSQPFSSRYIIYWKWTPLLLWILYYLSWIVIFFLKLYLGTRPNMLSCINLISKLVILNWDSDDREYHLTRKSFGILRKYNIHNKYERLIFVFRSTFKHGC